MIERIGSHRRAERALDLSKVRGRVESHSRCADENCFHDVRGRCCSLLCGDALSASRDAGLSCPQPTAPIASVANQSAAVRLL